MTSASATVLSVDLGWRPELLEPCVRFGFGDDREDLDLRFCNVIKHPDIADPEPVLRLGQAPKPLDATLADLRRLVREMELDRLGDPDPNWRSQPLDRRRCLWSHNDLKRHLARL